MDSYELLGEMMTFGPPRDSGEFELLGEEAKDKSVPVTESKTKAVVDIFKAIADAAGNVGAAALKKPDTVATPTLSQASPAMNINWLMVGGIGVAAVGVFWLMGRKKR